MTIIVLAGLDDADDLSANHGDCGAAAIVEALELLNGEKPEDHAPVIPAEFEYSLCLDDTCEVCPNIRTWIAASRAGGEIQADWYRDTLLQDKFTALRVFYKWSKDPQRVTSHVGYFDVADGSSVRSGNVRYCSVSEAIARQRNGQPVEIVLSADHPLAAQCAAATETARANIRERRRRNSADGWDGAEALAGKTEEEVTRHGN